MMVNLTCSLVCPGFAPAMSTKSASAPLGVGSRTQLKQVVTDQHLQVENPPWSAPKTLVKPDYLGKKLCPLSHFPAERSSLCAPRNYRRRKKRDERSGRPGSSILLESCCFRRGQRPIARCKRRWSTGPTAPARHRCRIRP